MYHKHFTSIDSTQKFLKENLDDLLLHSNDVLVSCNEQTNGIGRNGKDWKEQTNSIAQSFTFKPSLKASLTPIEIGILTIEFIKQEFQVNCSLKWPNDLLGPHKQKCGGILTQYINEMTTIAGVGLNLGKIEIANIDNTFKHGLDNVCSDLVISDEDKKEISKKYYQYLLNHRIKNLDDLKKRFISVCAHMNALCEVDDDNEFYTGIFKGIGSFGEAILLVDGQEKLFLSSSLKILN